jgi:uncharacterized membrane protein
MAIIVLSFGVYALVDGQSLSNLAASTGSSVTINLYQTAAIIIIVVAAIVIIVTFFGCCGAWKVRKDHQ